MLQAARDGLLVVSGGFSGKERTVAYAILYEVLHCPLYLNLYYGVLRAHEVLRQLHCCLHHTMLSKAVRQHSTRSDSTLRQREQQQYSEMK